MPGWEFEYLVEVPKLRDLPRISGAQCWGETGLTTESVASPCPAELVKSGLSIEGNYKIME